MGLVAAGHAASMREPDCYERGVGGAGRTRGMAREAAALGHAEGCARAGGPREAGSCQARRGAGPGDAAARAGLGACWGKAARGSKAPGCVGAPPRWLAAAQGLPGTLARVTWRARLGKGNDELRRVAHRARPQSTEDSAGASLAMATMLQHGRVPRGNTFY